MNYGYGYGKVILFGEHFVVHGMPALVAALHRKTVASVKHLTNEKSRIIDNRPKVPTFYPAKSEKYLNLVNNIRGYMNVADELEVTLAGDLMVTSGGIGASAATAASVAWAINNYYKLGLNKDQINQATFFGEQAVHGTPSGIDNTAAVFGGVFIFKNNPEENSFERVEVTLREPLNLLLIDSGQRSDTQHVIQQVTTLKNDNATLMKRITQEYCDLLKSAKDAFENNDRVRVGALMNQNHELLQKIGVSSSILDDIVETACQAGALGAKLTGTGCGGIVIALMPNKHVQNEVCRVLEGRGYFVEEATI